MVLASICYENRHLRVLVKDLLDATVVHTLPRILLACSSIIGFLGITKILGVGDVVWRVQVGVTAGRRCGILFEGSCVESAPSWINSGWTGELAYGETGQLSAVSRTDGIHAGRMPHRGCYPRRSTSRGGSKRSGTETTEPSGDWRLGRWESCAWGSAGEDQRH